jgi:protein phosphatase
VQRQQIKQILSEAADVEKKAHQLVQVACDAGGRDNVTVVLIEVEEDVSKNLPR